MGASAGDLFSLGIPRSRLWKQDLVDCDDYCRMAEAVILDTGTLLVGRAINRPCVRSVCSVCLYDRCGLFVTLTMYIERN